MSNENEINPDVIEEILQKKKDVMYMLAQIDVNLEAMKKISPPKYCSTRECATCNMPYDCKLTRCPLCPHTKTSVKCSRCPNMHTENTKLCVECKDYFKTYNQEVRAKDKTAIKNPVFFAQVRFQGSIEDLQALGFNVPEDGRKKIHMIITKDGIIPGVAPIPKVIRKPRTTKPKMLIVNEDKNVYE